MTILSSISPILLGASEFTLTIVLVVFVMLTGILLTIIILLCASKSFRAFFFRDAAKKKKAAEKKKQAAVQAETRNDGDSEKASASISDKSAPVQKPTTRGRTDKCEETGDASTARAPRPRASRKKEPDLFDTVLTVPLDIPLPSPAPTAKINDAQPRKNRSTVKTDRTTGDISYERLQTVVLPKTNTPDEQSKKSTFTTRTVTITRARAAAAYAEAQSKHNNAKAAQKPDTDDDAQDKKRTPRSDSKSAPKKR